MVRDHQGQGPLTERLHLEVAEERRQREEEATLHQEEAEAQTEVVKILVTLQEAGELQDSQAEEAWQSEPGLQLVRSVVVEAVENHHQEEAEEVLQQHC